MAESGFTGLNERKQYARDKQTKLKGASERVSAFTGNPVVKQTAVWAQHKIRVMETPVSRVEQSFHILVIKRAR